VKGKRRKGGGRWCEGGWTLSGRSQKKEEGTVSIAIRQKSLRNRNSLVFGKRAIMARGVKASGGVNECASYLRAQLKGGQEQSRPASESPTENIGTP